MLDLLLQCVPEKGETYGRLMNKDIIGKGR